MKGADAAAPVGRDSGDSAVDTGVDATILADGGPAGQIDSGCILGTLGCSGPQPEICTGAGGWQNVGAPCSGSTPVCLGGGCVECAPQSTQCASVAAGDGGVIARVQTCTMTGQWGAPVACTQPTPDCTGGTCTCLQSTCGSICADEQTDISNCGGCGQSCSAGPNPGCSNGVCSYTLFNEADASSIGPTAIAVDATHVYWTEYEAQKLMKVPLGGGTTVTLAEGQSFPLGTANLAIDATSAYWVTYGAGGAWAVMKVAKNGDDAGAVTTLASNFESSSSAGSGGIVVDANNVYWTDNPGIVGGRGTVFKCANTGCGSSPTPLSSNQHDPSGLALDSAGNLYWTNFDNGTVMRCATTGCGGNPATVSTGETQPMAITVNSTAALWTDYGNVWVGPLDGGSPTTLVSNSGGSAIAADSVHAYWMPNTNGGALMRVQIADGGTTRIATLTPGLSYGGVAVDSTYVYWASSAAIMKSPK